MLKKKSTTFNLVGVYSLANFADLIKIIEQEANGMKIDYTNAQLDQACTIALEYYNENHLKLLIESDIHDEKSSIKKKLLNKLIKRELSNLQEKKEHGFLKYLAQFIYGVFSYNIKLFKFLKILKKRTQHPFQKEILMQDTINSCYNMGIQAIPIVLFLGCAWGVIGTLQASLQLELFGFELYAIDVIILMFFKVMALLLTIVVLAARSGSSMIAKIGMMRVSDEWNYLKIIGIDPDVYILIPKIIAFVVLMPFLAYIACAAGIFGGYIVMHHVNHIGINVIFDVLRRLISFNLFMLIMLKGPIFGFIIGIICSYEAYSVSLNSESVVAAITKGVVYSIFVCILADVLMNILFFSLGIT